MSGTTLDLQLVQTPVTNSANKVRRAREGWVVLASNWLNIRGSYIIVTKVAIQIKLGLRTLVLLEILIIVYDIKK